MGALCKCLTEIVTSAIPILTQKSQTILFQTKQAVKVPMENSRNKMAEDFSKLTSFLELKGLSAGFCTCFAKH